jgi:hypothetical protein
MMLHDVRRVEVLEAHRLRVGFDDGAEGDVDIASLVRFEGVFAPLRESGYFARVRVDPELGTICWPNGADLDPEVLYSAATGVPLIQMYFREHPMAHFHVRYGEWRATVAIDPVAILCGELPPRVIGLVAEWTTLRREELRADWERARRGLPLERIAPLE